MKYARSMLAIGALTLSLPISAGGQESGPYQPMDTVIAGFAKSSWAAGTLELFWPTLGFAYAGNWSRGILPNAVRVIGIGSMMTSLSQGAPTSETRFWAGYGLFLGGTVWAIMGAVRTVRDHNERVKSLTSGLLVVPSPSGRTRFGLRLVSGLPLRLQSG